MPADQTAQAPMQAEPVQARIAQTMPTPNQKIPAGFEAPAVLEGADSNNEGGVISNEGFGSEYTFDDIASEPDRRGYFERIGSELKGSVMVDQSLTERLGNAFDAAYYGDPNTNTDGMESSVLFAKGFGEQLSDTWQEIKADPGRIIRDPLTLAYDLIETPFYYGTNGILGDPNSVARNQERGESLLNIGDAVEAGASDSKTAGYIFGGAILGARKGNLPGLKGRLKPIIGSDGQRIPFGFKSEAEF
jgi:hypothetical protein